MTGQGEIKARVGWLWFGIGVTLLYAGALYLLLPSPKTCGEAAGFVRYFDCYDLNAVGDFLAGVFAPIAFLWLVVAVLIQSQELSLQRQELRATREEVAENRKVAQAQADEAKKQAAFIGAQTDIATRQEADRRREQASEEMDIRVHGLIEWARQHIDERMYKIGGIAGASSNHSLIFSGDAQDEYGRLGQLARFVVDQVEMREPDYSGSGRRRQFEIRSLETLLQRLESLLALAERVSVSTRIRFADVNLAHAIHAVKHLLSIENKGETDF